MSDSLLRDFVRESNRIEGITGAIRPAVLRAHERFLNLERVGVDDLCAFVRDVAGAPIRDRVGMNVYVGDHTPPGGGRNILTDLMLLLERANKGALHTPYAVHQAYETLHPFMDGNGRSGRALWLWMMLQRGHDPYVLRRGFLHTWYYQSLSEGRP